jgi:RNA polymerase sigma-70 factor (ECF subfamily)
VSTPTPDEFAAFYDQTYAQVMRVARLLCGNEQDAEDLAADAYAEAFQYWGRIGTYEKPQSLVRKILKQRSGKARDRAICLAACLGQLRAPAPPTVEQVVAERQVFAAMYELPNHQREVMIRSILLGQSQEEIARAMSIERGTVAKTAFSARKNLGKALGYTPDGRDLGDALVAAGGSAPLRLGLAGEHPVDVAVREVAALLENRYQHDWAARERVRARVGELLAKGYPPGLAGRDGRG